MNQIIHKNFKKRADNYQPNSLTLSRQEWGVNDRKILAFVINQLDHNADYSQMSGMTFKIPIKEISEHVDYKYIKKSLLNLQDKKIQLLDDNTPGKEKFKSVVLFPEVSYNLNNDRMIEITVMRQSLEFLANLGKQYTRYNLDIFLTFSSIHSQRIYEIIMMQYMRGNGKKTFKFDIDELQSILGCNYENFAHLKRRVLDSAQKEIYEKADLIFEYEVSKRLVKKAVELKFTIQSHLDIAYQNVEIELQDYSTANDRQVYNVARNLLEQQYTFSPEQVNTILSNRELLDQFVEINAKIDNGVLHIKTSKTAYVAKSLGFNKRRKLAK